MLEPEIAALDDGAVDHLGVFVEPSLVLLRTSRNDHDVARAADLLFGAGAELHLALEHPNDLQRPQCNSLSGPPAPPAPRLETRGPNKSHQPV